MTHVQTPAAAAGQIYLGCTLLEPVRTMLPVIEGQCAGRRFLDALKRSLVSSESGPGERSLAPTCSVPRRRE
jgi:hypothetical protein